MSKEKAGTGLKLLSLLRPAMSLLPEVEEPEKKVRYPKKTLLILLVRPIKD